MTESKVDVRAVLRAEIERAGDEAYPVGRALIAADAAVAELIEAAKDCQDSELGDMACLGSMAPCENALGRLFAALAACTPAKSEGR